MGPAELRLYTPNFYTDQFWPDSCVVDFAVELLHGLSKLGPEDQNFLGQNLSLDEPTVAVSKMLSGKAPGIDGLPSDFF